MDTLKIVHVGCVLLSGAGFVLRSIWMWRGSPWLQARLTRVLPHVVDSLLLISAILLAVRIQQYPLIHDWLTVKVAALVLYIVLGPIALKRGRTRQQRIMAALAAMAVFAYIVAVAITRTPLPVPFPAG
ncbi:MAG TPA: regulator SirB [Gammaproteobacteria bacterium]|nr:regulator SirB [Gammaproteobacteria bacterium]